MVIAQSCAEPQSSALLENPIYSSNDIPSDYIYFGLKTLTIVFFYRNAIEGKIVIQTQYVHAIHFKVVDFKTS